MKRKTFSVLEFKNKINALLADPKRSDESKEGLCTSLENVLHATGNYNGFNYNYWLKEGCKKWKEAGEPDEYTIKNKYIFGDQGQYNRFYY